MSALRRAKANRTAKDADELCLEASRSEAAGDYEKAAGLYQKALALQKNPGIWGALAWALLKSGSHQKALTAARKMRTLALSLKSAPLVSLASCLIGRIHQEAGRPALAERFFRESIDARPRSDAYTFLGALLNEAGRSVEAKICYQNALSMDPNNADAHFNLARWYQLHRDFDRTIKHLQRAIELQPNNAPALTQLATVMWQYGPAGLQQAGELLVKAIKLDPQYLESRIILALTLKLQRKTKEAEQQFRQAMQQPTADSRLYWVFGHFLANDIGDAVEAEACFRKALEMAPQSGVACYYYGRFLLDQGRQAEAEEMLRQSWRLGFEKSQRYLQPGKNVPAVT